MIWFNLKELERRLKNGEVSDKLAFTYLLTHLIFMSVAAQLVTTDDDLALVQWGQLFISVGTTVWGVRKSFEINQRGGNREYFKRFLSLSFVAGIRMVVFAFIVSFFLVMCALIAESSSTVSFFLTTYQEAALHLGLYALFAGVFYYMLLTSFKRINAADGDGGQVETV